MVGLKRAREVIDDAAAKLARAAGDTRQAIICLGIGLAVVALIALIALGLAARARHA